MKKFTVNESKIIEAESFREAALIYINSKIDKITFSDYNDLTNCKILKLKGSCWHLKECDKKYKLINGIKEIYRVVFDLRVYLVPSLSHSYYQYYKDNKNNRKRQFNHDVMHISVYRQF